VRYNKIKGERGTSGEVLEILILIDLIVVTVCCKCTRVVSDRDPPRADALTVNHRSKKAAAT
jgi:hypothetical protein